MSAIRIIETDPQTDPRWQKFVVGHPEGSIYHHPSWIRALQIEYPSSEEVHIAVEGPDRQLIAILPMFYTRGLPLNFGGAFGSRRLSSLPRTPVAGPLSDSPEATAALLEAAVSRASQDPHIQLQIKTYGCELNNLVDELVCVPWRDSYVLRLPPVSEGPFRIANSNTRKKVKWAINKATRLGVQVRPAETETELYEWYLLYLETMRRNAVPPRPYRFFASLWELLRPQGMMELLVAEQHDGGRARMIAGSIFLLFGHTVSYAFNGSRLADLALCPNDVIQWQAIQEACRRGFRVLDFGEVPSGHRDLAKFKGKWGATAVRLHRYYYPSGCAEANGSGRFRGYAIGAGKALWLRVPLKTTAWIGDRLYSYL